MVPWSGIFHWIWFPRVDSFTEYGSMELFISLYMVPWSYLFHRVTSFTTYASKEVTSFTEYGSMEWLPSLYMIPPNDFFMRQHKVIFHGKWFPCLTSFTGHDPLECIPVIKYDFFWVTSFSRVTFWPKHELFLEGLLSWNMIFLCDIFGGPWFPERFLCGKWFPAEPWSL